MGGRMWRGGGTNEGLHRKRWWETSRRISTVWPLYRSMICSATEIEMPGKGKCEGVWGQKSNSWVKVSRPGGINGNNTNTYCKEKSSFKSQVKTDSLEDLIVKCWKQGPVLTVLGHNYTSMLFARKRRINIIRLPSVSFHGFFFPPLSLKLNYT